MRFGRTYTANATERSKGHWGVRCAQWMAIALLAFPVFGHCQTFVDGDPEGVLFTNHVGGYLGHGVSFADFNGDGFDDLTFAQFEGSIFTYAGDGNGGFAPIDLGIGNTLGEPKCPLWVDLDNDGDQDLLVTQRLAPNRIYARMPDGSLHMVPGGGGLEGTSLERTYGASVADYDNDGRLDVYFSQYHTPQTNSEPNRLYRNAGGVDLDMSFEETTLLAGVGNGVKQSFQATWIDVDRDGWLDLHVVNDRTFWPDALYRNMGDGTFVDMASTWGIDIGAYSMSTSFADFDKDLDWDIVVTNGANEGNNFLECAGQPFSGLNPAEGVNLAYQEVAEEAGILLDNLAWGAMWFDANNDRWLDLFVATGTSLYSDYPGILNLYDNSINGFFLNNEGQFPMIDASSNVYTDNDVTFCGAVADHNQDGALDFVSHRIGTHARLLNGVPNDNHWIQISLFPEEGNADAIGARVTAWVNGQPDVRTVVCGSEYMNQHSRRLHFGLGSAMEVDSVVVDWTSGASTTAWSLAANQHHALHELDANPGGETELGCTYALACNFDVSALVDDGSCDWSCACGTGTIWNASTQQCEASCSSDHNGDGVVGSADLIVFLTVFGLACP